MSSTTARKPPPPGSTGRTPTTPSSSPGSARTPVRSSTPTNGVNGVQRTRSQRTNNGTPVSARAAVRKPGAPSSLSQSASQVDGGDDETAREEAAAYLHDLKEKLLRAENEVDERQKEIEVFKARLDDALKEQTALEERAHEEEERVEALQNEKRELTRKHKELENIYEGERVQTMKDKEIHQTREEELRETIQRLKETLAMKDVRANVGEGDAPQPGQLSRTSSYRNSRSNSSQNLEASDQFAPPSTVQRSNSRNNSKLIHQKDKVIEGLRLELAEVQIKLVEMENMGGGRMRELEKQLLETRMTNARLMEDNESFQLLLSEKTLNGDFSRGDFMRSTNGLEDRAPSRSGPSTSLADELEGATEGDDSIVENDPDRKLEAEVNQLKEQNKALTLYINKIIERLLQHQGFESILDKNDLEGPDKNKELPPPPPPKENQQPSFLQRAKTMTMGGTGAGRNKPRPMSFMAPPPPPEKTINEDPSTAPSIPLGRSQSVRMSSGSYNHRRSTSEMPAPGAANVVNNMYRQPPPAVTPGATSPSIVSPRNSFFGIPIGTSQTPAQSRVPSSSGAIEEEKSGDKDNAGVDTPSPPRSNTSGKEGGGPAVMTGRGPRPLRLVAAEEEATKARKAANRASWFGGFFGQNQQQQQQQPQYGMSPPS